jgi:hypothetical protein
MSRSGHDLRSLLDAPLGPTPCSIRYRREQGLAMVKEKR